VSPPSALQIALHGPSFVMLVGGSGSGKSTFAEKHFAPTQIVSTDRCRALVGDREEVQAYSKQAFELFYFLIEKRMELNKTTIADSTALDPNVRRGLLDLAVAHGFPTLALLFTSGHYERRMNNRGRSRRVPEDVLERQQVAYKEALKAIPNERWDKVVLVPPRDFDSAIVTQMEAGVYSDVPPPYDVIGDLHGCYPELTELLDRLSWRPDGDTYCHPDGRTLVSIGDLGDRGPDSPACFRLFTRMVEQGRALFVPGNHDEKLRRYLAGNRPTLSKGLRETVEQLEALPQPEGEALERATLDLIERAPPYLVLDGGALVIAHGGIRKEMIGKVSNRIVSFTRYGDTTGARTPEGFPERRDWAAEYRGKSLIVYGHTPSRKPVLRYHTVNIDQGCAFGGALTALRYPELEFVRVRAHRPYADRKAPW